MAIEVFMKVARATAAHSNLHFLRRAIYPPPRVAKDLSLNAVYKFDDEILRLSSSDSLRKTVSLRGRTVAGGRKFRTGNCPRARVVTPLLRRCRVFLRVEPI